MIGGLILAGGRSSRFGREKALAELGGKPLIAHVQNVMRRGVSALAVSAQPGSAAAAYAAVKGLPCLPDEPGDASGPLAAIRAALRWANLQGLTWVVTCPCDTPFVPVDLVARLAAGSGSHGAVAATPAGLQPLCAIWPVSALPHVEDAHNDIAIRRLLADIDAAEVRFEDDSAFANLNTQEDYTQAQARLKKSAWARGRPASDDVQ